MSCWNIFIKWTCNNVVWSNVKSQYNIQVVKKQIVYLFEITVSLKCQTKTVKYPNYFNFENDRCNYLYIHWSYRGILLRWQVTLLKK